MPASANPHQIARKYIVGALKNCVTQTRERRGFHISILEAFTIFEAHAADEDGTPHTISTMAETLCVSKSKVSRNIRRLEEMHAVRLVRSGKNVHIHGDRRWFDATGDCREEVVDGLLDAAISIAPLRRQSPRLTYTRPKKKKPPSH